MTEYEEYKQTGMLGGYKAEEIQGKTLGEGKVAPIFTETEFAFDRDNLGLQRQLYVGGKVFKVTSVFKLKAEKTATDSMLHLIDHDLEKTVDFDRRIRYVCCTVPACPGKEAQWQAKKNIPSSMAD